MKESQTIEWKTSWRDEYLKHICAFANAQGGRLLIGIDDKGEVVGLKDIEKLLEDIPNKIVSYLGIIVDVNMQKKEDKMYLELIVPQSNIPISYKGVYYIKSGSTKQELKGSELQNFILRKIGKTFDELPASGSAINDIDEKVVYMFIRKSIKANRIALEADNDNISDIITNLKLKADSGELKNAAILLFCKDPLRFFSSVTFKIGRFGAGMKACNALKNWNIRRMHFAKQSLMPLFTKIIRVYIYS